jgi:methylthioribose-1-phosphate isomerase
MAMQDIAELERRITAALDRIGAGLDRLPAAGFARDLAPDEGHFKDLARVQSALDEERMVTAQLNERLKSVKEKEALLRAELDEKCQRLTRQLDTQGLELQRMRKTAVQLREQLREIREAQLRDTDPNLVNKAMLTELEALRATRMTEMAEMDELIAELSPLLEEAPTHA